MVFNKRIIRTFSYMVALTLLAISVTQLVVKRALGSGQQHLLSDYFDLEATEAPVPDALVGIGFTSCHSFGFVESCHDDINNVYKMITNITNDHQLIRSIKIDHSKKDLWGDSSYFTSAHPYEIKLPLDLVKKFNIPIIEQFYVFNENDGYTMKNIPNQILQNTKNVTDIKQLNRLGYTNAGYGVWYRSANSYTNSYSNVNFLFHSFSEHPIPGWEPVSPYPINLRNGDKYSTGSPKSLDNFKTFDYHTHDYDVYFYAKRSSAPALPQISLDVKPDGTFKIVQLADLHLSTGFGKCLDPYPALSYPLKNCLADVLTLNFVEQTIDVEKPDLVVLSGDQVLGESSFDTETTLLKLVEPLVQRKIPYTLVFGNHDDLGSMDRSEMMDLVQSFPYSLAVPGPAEVDGIGNYDVTVGNSDDPKIVIFMLDSHSRLKEGIGYEWFKDTQKNYVELVSSAFVESPNALKLAFFHIPLFEYRNINHLSSDQYQGNFKEAVISSNTNSDMFRTLKEVGVKLVSVGHDHCNDFCFENDGVTLCYGGGAGYGGYGKTHDVTEYQRRIRVFEVDTNENNQIKSWKRVDNSIEDVIDEFVYNKQQD